MIIWGPIKPTFLIEPSESKRRVLLFDPTEIYHRAPLINRYKRSNSIGMEHLFLQSDLSKCACGCGEALTGRRTRWASDVCKNFAVTVFLVLRGDSDVIRRLMLHYLPHECVKCKCGDYSISTINGDISGLHVEHIVSIKDGGGCCWLGNFQFMCHRCHAEKTRMEKLLRNKQKPMPVSKLF